MLQAPAEAPAWNGVLNATKYAPRCIQRSIFAKDVDVVGSEDCLYLNVFTPRVS